MRRRPLAISGTEPAKALAGGATLTLPAEAASRAGTLPPAPVTRIESVHTRRQLGARDIRLGIWLGRLRRFGAIAAWLLVLLIIMAIVVLGSRPAPTEFNSLSHVLT